MSWGSLYSEISVFSKFNIKLFHYKNNFTSVATEFNIKCFMQQKYILVARHAIYIGMSSTDNN